MPIEQSPAFSFYVKEWRSSRAVQRMTFAQRGMYLEMLLEQWENLSLPDSPVECAHLIGGTEQEWIENWPVLRRKFVERRAKGRPKLEADPAPIGRIWNLRLEQSRKQKHLYRDRARNGGISKALSAKRSDKGTYLPAGEPASSQPESSIPIPIPIPSSIPIPSPVRTRTPSLIRPRLMNAAFEAERVWVHHKQHAEFERMRNHPGAGAELMAWYQTVADEWTTGARARDELGGDMWAFWRARYSERWPPAPRAVTPAEKRSHVPDAAASAARRREMFGNG